MRALGAALRVAVEVERTTGNTGDGTGFGTPATEYANVKGTRNVRRTPQGSTVVDPYVLEFRHDVDVPVGSRVTVDGEAAIVESSELVRGGFGVPHHREVRAL